MKPTTRVLPALLAALLLAPWAAIEAGRGSGGRGGSSGGHGGGARMSGRASAPARGPSMRSGAPSRGSAPRASTRSSAAPPRSASAGRSSSATRSTASSGRSARPSPYGTAGRASSTSASRTPSGDGVRHARGEATYGYGHGGYYPYYPYYPSYPYYPYYPYYYPYYYSSYYPYYWNGWDWSWGVGFGWYGYPGFSTTVYVSGDGGGGYATGDAVAGGDFTEGEGASEISYSPPAVIETKVQPKKAEVWIDGSKRGEARDFNGAWDSLTVPAGDHLVEFRLEGHQTLRVYLRTEPGVRYVIEEDLPEGDGVLLRGSPPDAQEPTASAGEAPSFRMAPPAEQDNLRRGLLRVSVDPPDAAVYLDGEFLASGDALARLHGALPVAAGTHVIEVMRPGFEPERREVTVESGVPTEIEVSLAKSARF